MLEFILVAGINVVAAFLFQIILHELGHCLMGMLTGWRLIYIQLGHLIFCYDQKTGKYKLRKVLGKGFQCIMSPHTVNTPSYWYTLGGLLLNLLFFILGLFILTMIELNRLMLLFVLSFTISSLAFLITNGIPSVKNVCNDMACYLLTKGSKATSHCHNLQLIIAGELIRGKSYAGMQEELFQLEKDIEINDITAYSIILNYYHYLDNENYEEAYKELCRIPVIFDSVSLGYLEEAGQTEDRVRDEELRQKRDIGQIVGMGYIDNPRHAGALGHGRALGYGRALGHAGALGHGRALGHGKVLVQGEGLGNGEALVQEDDLVQVEELVQMDGLGQEDAPVHGNDLVQRKDLLYVIDLLQLIDLLQGDIHRSRTQYKISHGIIRVYRLELLYYHMLILLTGNEKITQKCLSQNKVRAFLKENTIPGDIHALRVNIMYQVYIRMSENDIQGAIDSLQKGKAELLKLSCVYQGEKQFCLKQLEMITKLIKNRYLRNN